MVTAGGLLARSMTRAWLGPGVAVGENDSGGA
jgi:hypothetical protein